MSKVDLEKIIKKAGQRLKKVQRSDEKTKKRYLVLLSSLAMIVVVGLWFFYLSFALPQPVAEEIEGNPGAAVQRGEDEDSFFKTVGRGTRNIFEDLKNQFLKFKESLNQVQEFTLEGGGADFTPKEEPLMPAPLP